MKLVGERTITAEQITEVVENIEAKKCSKGAGIRTLFAGGMEVKEISSVTGIRYNHVYNVVRNEVLVHDLEVEKSGRSNENSKKNQIVKLLEEGKTITEVSKELKCMYNYAWQVAKGAGYTGKKKTQENIVITVPDDLVEEKQPVAKKSTTKKESKKSTTKKGAKTA